MLLLCERSFDFVEVREYISSARSCNLGVIMGTAGACKVCDVNIGGWVYYAESECCCVVLICAVL